MICENQAGYTETKNGLIELEKRSNFSIGPESGNRFSPIHEIVDHKYDVVVYISGSGIACDKIYSPFSERTNGDNQVEGDGVSMHFLCENLTRMALLDYCDVVFKQSGPVIACTQDFMGSSYARKMTVARPCVTVI